MKDTTFKSLRPFISLQLELIRSQLHYTTHFNGRASRMTSPAVQGLVATREMAWDIQYSVPIPFPAQIKGLLNGHLDSL
jgi:hypothetical protein